MTNTGIAGLDARLLARAGLRRWRFLATLTLLAAVLSALGTLLVPNTYTASVAFLPELRPAQGLPSSVAGLAAQFGVSVGSEPSQSPQFYADLVKSRTLLDRLLRERYDGTADGRGRFVAGGEVVGLLRAKGKSPAARLEVGRELLSAATAVTVDRRTGVIRLSVRAEDPAFAAWAANQLVAYLANFNMRTRQSQARAQREFAEARSAEAQRNLAAAEGALRSFYEENRDWDRSPRLRFEEGRLRRRMEIHSEVYSSLLRQAESARIAEVNNLPLITVIDAAEPPTRKSGPQRRVTVAAATAAGLLLGFGLVLLLEVAPDLRRAMPEAWDVVERLRRPFRRR